MVISTGSNAFEPIKKTLFENQSEEEIETNALLEILLVYLISVRQA